MTVCICEAQRNIRDVCREGAIGSYIRYNIHTPSSTVQSYDHTIIYYNPKTIFFS